MKLNGITGLPPIDFDKRAGLFNQDIIGAEESQLQSRDENLNDFLTFAIPGVIAGFADTVAGSIGIVDDTDFEEFFKSTVPVFGDFYARNKVPLQTASDLTGLFIPGMLAIKAVRGASTLARLINGGRKNALLDSIFLRSGRFERTMQSIKNRDKFLARRGVAEAGEDATRKALVRRAQSTRISDIVKENLAFEAGVFLTMNDSQTLYPDEFTTAELIALNAAFPAIFSLGSFVRTKRLLRASIADASPLVEAARNPAGVPQPISRGATSELDGSRDTAITINALSRNTIEGVISETAEREVATGAVFELKKTNLTKEMNAIDGEIKIDIEHLGKDKPFEFNNSVQLSKAHINTARNSVADDEFTLLGAESLESLPLARKDQLEILAARQTEIDKVDTEINVLLAERKTLSLEASKEIDTARIKEISEILPKKILQHERLNNSELYVLDPDGTLLPLRDRKPTSRDATLDIKIVRASELEPKRFEVTIKSDSVFGTPEVLIGITDDLQMILPRIPEAQVKISNINVTKVLTRIEVSAPENFKEILRDMGTDWHVLTQSRIGSANRGHDVFKTLPKDVQDALRSWVNSPRDSPIRGWFEIGDPRAAILMKAFAPMRQRLHEIADSDGTIPLLRGERTSETLKPTNDIVSMTSSPNVAKRFAENVGKGEVNVIVRRVHPDDVIVIVSGLGQEFEYIVKGNLKRVAIPTEVKSSFEALTLEQRTATFAGLQKAIEAYKPGVTKINISSDDHFTRLDAIIELHRKFGNRIFDDINLPQGMNSIEDLMFASLSRKYEDFVRMQKVTEASNDKVLKLSDEQRLTHIDMVKMLNLPGTNNGDLPALFKVFLELHVTQGENNLKQAIGNLDNLKRAVQEVETIPEIMPFKRDGASLMGNQLHFPEDSLPLLVTKRSVSDEQYGRDNLVNAVTVERARVFGLLANASEKGGDLVQGIIENIVARPDLFRIAKGVHTLTEGQQRGTQAAAQFSFAIGENAALNGQHAVRLNTSKAHRIATEAIFAEFIPVFNKLKVPNPESRAALASTNLYIHARRQGWDITESTEELGQGLFGFKLENTERNQARFLKMFGRKIRENEFMPSPGTNISGKFLTYQPLALPPLALEAAFAFNTLSSKILANKNVLRNAMGRGEMRRRPMHVPPVNFGSGEVVFIMSDAGEMISTVSGRNLAEARTKARTEISEIGGGAHIKDAEDVERYFDIRDKAFVDMMDFTDPLLQTGPITGKQVGRIIDTGQNSLNDVIRAYERQFESILRQTRAVVFEPEVAFARKRFAAVNPVKGEAGLSIWQQYISAIFDNPTLNPNQLIGMSNLTVEKYYDTLLSTLSDRYAQVFNPPGLKKAKADKNQDQIFRGLEKSLGEFNPFQSGVDFANKTFDVAPPLSMKRQMSKLTSFTSFMTLRMFEVGHFVLTMTSLAATMPGVISFMKMTDLEKTRGTIGQAEFSARIGAFGIPVDKNTAMFSPVRAMTTATHEWFNDPAFRAAMGRAGDQGYFDQAVSEAFKSLTAPAEGYREGILRRAGDIVSILSDKGERWARAWSFAVGYSIAKRSGLEGDAVRFTMANDFANKVIGDFSPTNRPRIFQGATGMPLGLFMTFMWNYHQRLFSYIENGANRALATQVATQAAVFGGQTIPGFQQFSQFFLSNYDGTANPIDGMTNRFGHEATEMIMSGTVSNLPKLFGFEDGLSFSTRGDVNPRNFPTLLTLGDTPVFQMFQDFFNIIRETTGMLRTRGGVDDDQMAEIIQSYSTNRFMRSMATMYTGFVTDRRGQVIAGSPSFKDVFRGDIQNEIALIARMTGVRTLNEQARIDAHSRNRVTDISRRYRLGELRDVIRSDFRSGKDSIESIEKSFEQYIRFGGSVDHFPRFMMEQFMRARVDKTSLEIMKTFNNPQKIDNLLRLMNVL